VRIPARSAATTSGQSSSRASAARSLTDRRACRRFSAAFRQPATPTALSNGTSFRCPAHLSIPVTDHAPQRSPFSLMPEQRRRWGMFGFVLSAPSTGGTVQPTFPFSPLAARPVVATPFNAGQHRDHLACCERHSGLFAGCLAASLFGASGAVHIRATVFCG